MSLKNNHNRSDMGRQIGFDILVLFFSTPIFYVLVLTKASRFTFPIIEVIKQCYYEYNDEECCASFYSRLQFNCFSSIHHYVHNFMVNKAAFK